jgi:hypothetical protein
MSGKNIILAIVFSLVIVPVASFPGSAHACSCAISTPQERYERSEAVFIGRVVDIDDSREFVSELGSPQHRRVDMHVTERWKGIRSNFVTVATGMGGGDCGYDFESNKEYLIYAGTDFYGNGEFSTGICGGVTPLTEAREEIETLGPSDTLFSDDEIVYTHGSFPINEGLLTGMGLITNVAPIVMVLGWPLNAIHNANHTILTGSWYEALAIVALYIAVPVALLYWLYRWFKQRP